MEDIVIVFLSGYPLGGSVRLGGSRYVANLAEALNKVSGVEIVLLTLTDSPDSPGELPDYVHCVESRRAPFGWPFASADILGVIRRISPSIVHVQGSTQPQYTLPLLQLEGTIPTALTVHGIAAKESSLEGQVSKLRACTGALHEAYLVRKVKNIIVLSEYVRSFFAPRTKSNIFVVPSGVEDKFFELPPAPDVPNALYVGGLEPRKGIHDLVLAFAKVIKEIPEAVLRIVGPVRSTRYLKLLQSLIELYSLSDWISIVGPVSEEQLLDSYSESSVFVFPSYEESFGIAALEAMASGRAVLATHAGGVGSMMVDGHNCILVEEGNVNELASSLASLFLNKDLRNRLARSGRETASRYGWGSIAEEMVGVYREILSR